LFSRIDLATGQATLTSASAANIRTVSSEKIADLAVAFADSLDPVIYYNPRLMARVGPELSAFVLAHEAAHIQLGHRRPILSDGASHDSLEIRMQGFELAADCLAASRLVRERPAALSAAITFFERMGPDRLDREHPSGSARAARLISCSQTQNGDLRHFSSEGPRLGATALDLR
jgi:hypothetical protein